MVQTIKSTISRAFIGWAVFLSTVFKWLELKPLLAFVQAHLPQEFYDAGYGETEALGDATETWISQSENYDINNITFSSYKNHTTVTLIREQYLIRTSLNNVKYWTK